MEPATVARDIDYKKDSKICRTPAVSERGVLRISNSSRAVRTTEIGGTMSMKSPCLVPLHYEHTPVCALRFVVTFLSHFRATV